MWYIIVVFVIIISVFGYTFYENQQKISWYESSNHSYDLDKLQRILMNFSSAFKFHGKELPFGRANGFYKEYISSDAAVEYFGFDPVPSTILEEFKEYGVLLTSEGLLFKNQEDDRNSDKHPKELFIDFKGLWKIKRFPSKLRIYYYQSDPINLTISNYISDDNIRLTHVAVEDFLQRLVDIGITRDLLKEDKYLDEIYFLNNENENLEFKKTSPDEWYKTYKNSKQPSEYSELDDEVEERAKKSKKEEGFINSFISATSLKLSSHTTSSNIINQIKNRSGGAGYAAEVYNNVEDKLRIRRAEVVGGDNALNGADRMVSGVEIQTKYYRTAGSTVNSAFDENGYRYISKNGDPMQLEVPSDQYISATELMREKILSGEVRGVTDPNESYRIIRKGHATYDQAQLMTQAFNVTSITHDLKSGLITSSSPAGVSVLIVFAHAKWSGATTEEAFTLAAKVGIIHITIGTIMHATTAQLTRAALNTQLVTLSGARLNQAVVNGVPVIVTSIAIFGVDTIEYRTGRISNEQFRKNIAIKGAGIGGAMLGASLPFIGTSIGAFGLGTLTYIGAQKIFDYIYKDDKEKHYPILKEEFMDLIYSIKLSETEIEQIKTTVFNKKFNRHIKNMQKQLSIHKDTRVFARDNIIFPEVSKVIGKRKKIKQEELNLLDHYFEDLMSKA